MKKITLKDIAEVTGLSINSVSRALKDKDSISAETRKTVQQVAKEMGYIPNSLASSMRSGRTYSIAILLGEIVNPYNACLMNHLTTYLYDRGYTTLMFVTNQRRTHEIRAVQAAIGKNVDAIINTTQLRQESLELITNHHIPFVQIGLISKEPNFFQVSKDEYHSGYIAAQHLLSKGHRRILHIIFPEQFFAFSRERMRGIRAAYAEYNVPLDENLIYTYYREDTIQHILSKAMTETPSFTAVIAGNDVLAWQVVETLQEKGIRVPQDCGVTGFDDLHSLINVPYVLTSVAANLSNLSHHAIDMLMAQLDHEITTPQVYTEETYLVEGETT